MTNISKVKTRTCSDPPVCLHTHTHSHIGQWCSGEVDVTSSLRHIINPSLHHTSFTESHISNQNTSSDDVLRRNFHTRPGGSRHLDH